jgi:hypothetical protein
MHRYIGSCGCHRQMLASHTRLVEIATRGERQPQKKQQLIDKGALRKGAPCAWRSRRGQLTPSRDDDAPCSLNTRGLYRTAASVRG